jgi:hypothetical protein
MYITEKDKETLELLDKLLHLVDNEFLKDLIEKEEIVGKLKGSLNGDIGIIRQMVEIINSQSIEITSLKSELMLLRGDMTTMLKVMNKPFDTAYTYEFQNLKSRYGVF